MCAAFHSRRESISDESPTSFPEDTSIRDSNPRPLDYNPSVITTVLGKKERRTPDLKLNSLKSNSSSKLRLEQQQI
ncbi:hypothetical protein TNCV_1836151 [Trichonephila clavipes]|nr:hypothetical protein TNCV_1836151 [Trichonephila clavipes]